MNAYVCSNLVLRLEQDSRYCEYSGIVSIACIARCVGASSIAMCCPALNYIHMRAREGERAPGSSETDLRCRSQVTDAANTRRRRRPLASYHSSHARANAPPESLIHRPHPAPAVLGRAVNKHQRVHSTPHNRDTVCSWISVFSGGGGAALTHIRSRTRQREGC